ncbi:MAG TPA: glycosyltransferase family 4 protein, partial [Gemmatirosa sp.]
MSAPADDRALGSWTVVHKGARDGYQVPLALAEAGRLDALVTDWYSPLDRRWFRGLAGLAPARVRRALAARYRDGLPSRHVRVYPRDYVMARFEDARDRRGDAAIGRAAGQRARARGTGILAYSCYAHAAFPAYGDGGGPKVVFQVHPHPASLRALFAEEAAHVPEAAGSLAREPEMSLAPAVYAARCEEAHLADLCLVASDFTRLTLVAQGIDARRVRVVPYGVELPNAVPVRRDPDDTFRVLFVGQFIQRKGVSYLLDAWRRLALPNAELVIAGRGGSDDALLARYDGAFRPGSVRRTGPVTRDALRRLYETSDVLCMPSLAEGFGLVYLEAMAHGTPVIATPNTGVADLIRDGDDGFLVGVRDADALAARLAWCHAHRGELAAMRARARAVAARQTWGAFRLN